MVLYECLYEGGVIAVICNGPDNDDTMKVAVNMLIDAGIPPNLVDSRTYSGHITEHGEASLVT